MDPRSNTEFSALLPRLLDLAMGRYRLVGVPHGDCPAQFIMAIPEVGDGQRTAWLPAAARAGEGRAPSGGGMSRNESLTRCLGEAIELLSSCWWGQESFCRTTAVQLGKSAILPNDIALISERQYAERDRWNAIHGSYAWLPEPFDSSRPVDWVEAKSPKGDETKLVPAACVLIGYSNAGEQGCFCVGDSNGCAAADSLETAAARGFLELVERDATAIWWYGRHCRPQINLKSLTGYQVLLNWLDGRPRRSHVLDITSDLGIPVFVAVSHELDGSTLALGFGADFDPERAVISALLEMCQMEISFEIFRRQESVSSHPGFAAWLEAANVAACPWCRPTPEEAIDLGWERAIESDGAMTSLDHCLEVCEAHDLRMFYVDLTRSEFAIPVARVIVPGLRHYKPRFAPGRLYGVSVSLGWQSIATDEAQLNALPLIV
jgi:ribosomal protein S12 methylthiotransferase accessory factor